MSTKTDLQNELTAKGIAFKSKDTIATLTVLLENNMTETETEVNPFEGVVLGVLNTMKESGEKYVEMEMIKRCMQVESDPLMYDYMAENGRDLAIQVGLLENAEERKERVAKATADKKVIEVALADAIEELDDELPTDNEAYTTMLNGLVEASGASKAKVRATLKPIYEGLGVDMPKATRQATAKTPGFQGLASKMRPWAAMNPDSTAEERTEFLATLGDYNEKALTGHERWLENLCLFAQEVILANEEVVLAEVA